ncbi:hypothetical protein PHLCEN_2v4574 [Hermanssonia centrifuga]|uniref:Uncharacterized protein n=1 Tax=Hermanssonia centrifuga TaxID=98765 RepID=A0A2R6PN59_9APHY|nr:hypothetical protein PHLCEN_2v4574 [Hermanssonia centrifuga]
MVCTIIRYKFDKALTSIKAISVGADVAIVIVSIVVFVLLLAVYIVARKVYRKRKDKRHAPVPTRELDLDFDTTDVEVGVSTRGNQMGHWRGLSDSSTDSSTPLMFQDDRIWKPSIPTSHPFNAGMYPVAPTSPQVPQPTAPAFASFSSQDAATPNDRQLSTLASRPSILAHPPRTIPRPVATQRSRSRAAPDMRANLLTRLTSTRSGHKADTTDERSDSPSSMYSQSSATTMGYWELEGDHQLNGEAVPAVPALPSRFRSQDSDDQFQVQTQQDEDLTFDEGAVSASLLKRRAQAENSERLAELEESLTFPLPSPTTPTLPLPMKSPSNGLFTQSSSPPDSPTTAHSYMFPPIVIPSTPSYPIIKPLQASSRDGDVISVRSVEGSRNVPYHGDAYPRSFEDGGKGPIHFQVPPSWRVVDVPRMPTPPVSRGGTPENARVASFIVQ